MKKFDTIINQNAGVIYNNFSNISGNVVMNVDDDEILIDGRRVDLQSLDTPESGIPFEICRKAILKKGINVHIESDLNVVVRQVTGNQLVAVASGELFGTHHPQLAITRDGTGLLVTAKFVKSSCFVQDGRLEIRLPKGLMPEVCVETRNANITFSYVTLDRVQADSYNGNIVFMGSLGDRLTAATYNGDIDLRVVALDSIRVDGKSYNGDVAFAVSGICHKDIRLVTRNGDVYDEWVSDNAEYSLTGSLHSYNGDVLIS